MTKLSQIESEARRQVGKLPEEELRGWQEALAELCETRWSELRGPQPETPLAAALWSITPHWGDLLVELDSRDDPRLAHLLQRRTAAQALAALVLMEFERGNAAGGRIAYEAMMLNDSEASRQRYGEEVCALLSGQGPSRRKARKHAHHTPLEKAVAAIATVTGRYDAVAVLAAIDLLTTAGERHENDPELQSIQEQLERLGIHFDAVDAERVTYSQHKTYGKTATIGHIADIVAELRGILV